MEERRKLERFKLALPTSIEIVGPEPAEIGTSLDSLTRDVSSGGAFFLTRESIPTGTCVKVEMALKEENRRQTSGFGRMKASGYVIRIEPTGMAVCFSGRCRLMPCL